MKCYRSDEMLGTYIQEAVRNMLYYVSQNTTQAHIYYVSQNTTQAQVLAALHQTCSKLGVFGTEVGF